jgi:RNA polymerase sigma factor (sigma-70 family)
METDETRVAQALAGDPSAAADVFARVWPDAYRIAWSILRNPSSAEDAAQEASARAWAALGTLRDPQRFDVWFYRIVVNECNRRKRGAHQDVCLHESALPVVDVNREERIDVRRAIDNLTPALRLTIILRYYFTLSSVEIAQIVRTSPVTVRWRLMLAHRQLRVVLQEQPPNLQSPEKSEEQYADESVALS